MEREKQEVLQQTSSYHYDKLTSHIQQSTINVIIREYSKQKIQLLDLRD